MAAAWARGVAQGQHHPVTAAGPGTLTTLALQCLPEPDAPIGYQAHDNQADYEQAKSSVSSIGNNRDEETTCDCRCNAGQVVLLSGERKWDATSPQSLSFVPDQRRVWGAGVAKGGDQGRHSQPWPPFRETLYGGVVPKAPAGPSLANAWGDFEVPPSVTDDPKRLAPGLSLRCDPQKNLRASLRAGP
jgi:hypothetical protein